MRHTGNPVRSRLLAGRVSVGVALARLSLSEGMGGHGLVDGGSLLEVRLVGHVVHKWLRIQILSRRHVDVKVRHIHILVVVVHLHGLLGVGVGLLRLLALLSEEGSL